MGWTKKGADGSVLHRANRGGVAVLVVALFLVASSRASGNIREIHGWWFSNSGTVNVLRCGNASDTTQSLTVHLRDEEGKEIKTDRLDVPALGAARLPLAPLGPGYRGGLLTVEAPSKGSPIGCSVFLGESSGGGAAWDSAVQLNLTDTTFSDYFVALPKGSAAYPGIGFAHTILLGNISNDVATVEISSENSSSIYKVSIPPHGTSRISEADLRQELPAGQRGDLEVVRIRHVGDSKSLVGGVIRSTSFEGHTLTYGGALRFESHTCDSGPMMVTNGRHVAEVTNQGSESLTIVTDAIDKHGAAVRQSEQVIPPWKTVQIAAVDRSVLQSYFMRIRCAEGANSNATVGVKHDRGGFSVSMFAAQKLPFEGEKGGLQFSYLLQPSSDLASKQKAYIVDREGDTRNTLYLAEWGERAERCIIQLFDAVGTASFSQEIKLLPSCVTGVRFTDAAPNGSIGLATVELPERDAQVTGYLLRSTKIPGGLRRVIVHDSGFDATVSHSKISAPPESQASLQEAEKLFRRAEELAHIGKQTEAIPLYRKILEILPNFRCARQQLIGALISAGFYKDARAEISKFLELEPNDVGALTSQALLEIREGNLDAAVQTLEDIVTRDPDSSDVWARLSELKIITGDPNGARVASEYALALDGKNVSALLSKARVDSLLADQSTARTSFEDVVRITSEKTNRDVTDNIALVGGLLGLHRFDEAVRESKSALDASGGNDVLRSVYIDALSVSNKIPEAIEQQRVLVEHTPHDGSTRMRLGTLLRQTKEYQESEVELLKAKEILPRNGQVLIELSLVYLDSGQVDRAIEASREAQKLNPKLPYAFNNEAVGLERQGKVIDAYHAYSKAAELAPNDSLIQKNLAGIRPRVAAFYRTMSSAPSN